MPNSVHGEILEALATFRHDPLGFATFAFPWGEAGSELSASAGLEAWQAEVLTLVAEGLSLGDAIQLAVASGHGVGKSALVAILILWAISTCPDTRGVITANTENQLKTKTWVELQKWYRMFIGRDFFDITATKIASRDPEHADTWRVDMVPWSIHNTEAFAGLHNKGSRVFVAFDEGSAIPDQIFEVTQGALTDEDTELLWFVFGNPTKSTGRFREAFPGGRFAHRWRSKSVDSRTVSITNKRQIALWAEDYGEDSDWFRVRVRGEFPRTGNLEFISAAAVAEARKREVIVHLHDPFVIGVDVARFGDDASVIFFRKGRDAKSIPPVVFRGIDTMALAGRVAEYAERFRPDAIFVDGGGVGGGVIDRLRQLRVDVLEVQFGARPDRLSLEGDASLYANKRAEIWGFMREWLKGGSIPDETGLAEELISPMYGFNAQNAILLESKDAMRKRGAASPDQADALALTFAQPIMKNLAAGGPHLSSQSLVESEYDPMEMA